MPIIEKFHFRPFVQTPHLMKFWDPTDKNAIQGTTGMGRLDWFFEDLETKLISEKELDRPLDRSGRPFRILIAPCSIGAQTIELALRLEKAGLENGKDFEIYGLDINARFIQAAKEEMLPLDMIDWLPKPLAWMKGAFVKAAGNSRFCKLQSDRSGRVKYWEPQSLSEHDPQGDGQAFYDAVICSHLVYHLSTEEAKKVIGRMAGLIRPGGLAILDTGTMDRCDFLQDEFTGHGFVGVNSALNPGKKKDIDRDLKRRKEKCNVFAMARPKKTIAEHIGLNPRYVNRPSVDSSA